ncbi:alpha/beta fold hydrolase [Acuticoccus sp. M5D2P5]|uniref:alpha/beta fold hydrolase n=1 Tax=Acuticoccus kalidii TaxID=2910977 RepID=UPI001F31E087|nr:alpha/beta fold hydrolase [Acuticoccus kalidii]MCF3935647.1 alpha/beta fold hydrolase [Acuticoccus kalidii]
MPSFSSDGVTIDYLDEGEGPAVLLIHGFASNRMVNWVNTSWTTLLKRAGYRVLAIDNRGHGKSEKLYDPAQYRAELMAADAIRVLDHAGVEKAAIFGYSMGARIAAFATVAAPERVWALVIAGLASNLIAGIGGSEEIAEALEAASPSDVADDEARAFRIFAGQTGADRKALAACIRASRQAFSEASAASIDVPTLVVAGELDEIAGSADGLAALIPGAKALTLPGRDHMSAVGDKLHKSEVVAFLDATRM